MIDMPAVYPSGSHSSMEIGFIGTFWEELCSAETERRRGRGESFSPAEEILGMFHVGGVKNLAQAAATAALIANLQWVSMVVWFGACYTWYRRCCWRGHMNVGLAIFT